MNALLNCIGICLILSVAGCGGDDSEDTTPPTVVSTTPADMATGVPVGSILTLVFSEPVTAASLGDGILLYADQSTDRTIGGYESQDGKTVLFTPNSPLESDTVYELTLTTDIVDLAGNAIVDNYTISFTTEAAP
jgi:methionine-rich copper-binding protein CopC